ncbi:uncharacterized protein PHACADRAFT_265043 [Phanerochaete carnosa HHB-10118-sp]|uniref:SP-RING-type domain-containing protein n=1 Tax=Phanerochaete carnosa (strain HHB-10118-sp) TaxID=650164 RepID=K5VEE1_PHACS|nr:uncharacterized protein PHACADRAFT_265043 [Phanerochaete carnosa HHB-10118-sp]EKM49518.1 hypothetical protein PHACADRAFT_265043 [Phanerochaete carnosa HHB-10118-sp]
MPVATSSRRLRRQDTDDIEDATATQVRDEEVDDVEAASQPRRTKGAKRDKKARQELEDEGDEGGNDNGQHVDNPLADFADQPIDKQQAGRISGLSQDWAQIRGLHNSSYSLVQDIGSALAEFTEGEKAEKNLAEIDKMMRSLIDTENELRAHEDTLTDLYQQVIRGEAVPEVISRYDSGVGTRQKDYGKKTSRQKYAKHEDYANFRQGIYEIQHPDEAMPPVADFIPAEEGDDSDDDDDVQVGGVTQDYRCPLTLKLLEDPLTSSVCNHSFDASAIREFLKNDRTARQKCPNAGCHKIISLNDLKPNKELAKKAKEAARRERMREEEDSEDDENVIE